MPAFFFLSAPFNLRREENVNIFAPNYLKSLDIVNKI